MISVNEFKALARGLRDDDFVGMEEGGLTLYTEDGNAWIEIGGLPGGRMKSLGIKTYLPGDQGAASHIHRLVRIDEASYRYRCVDCGARLQRLYARCPRPKHVDKIMGMLRKPGFARGLHDALRTARRNASITAQNSLARNDW